MDIFDQHITGVVKFDVPDLTRKHENQSTWKKHVIAYIDNPDFCDYYSWFIKKRYNIPQISNPIRGCHFTLVNDRLRDFPEASIEKYNLVKEKYDGTEIDIRYSLDPRTDGTHWWLRSRCDAASRIRTEIGVSETPYFGFHITIGRISGPDWMLEHGKYIHKLIENDLIY